ncbi:MAG: hypothetical protein Q8P90_02020 [bacterium]|nr:hypothetical protein [bacterium]
MKYLWRIGFSLLIISFAGCALIKVPKQADVAVDVLGEEQIISLSYHPTQCNNNPWKPDSEIDARGEAIIVETYYQMTHDIDLKEVEVQMAPADYRSCSACGCPTGDVINVQVAEADRNAMLDLGFIEGKFDESVITINESTEADNIEIITEVEIKDDEDEDITEEVADIEAETEVEIIDGTNDVAEVEPTGADGQLKVVVESVQKSLQTYYDENGAYPESLLNLELSEEDTVGITYTPIGTVPAKYYDLSVEYSTGREVLNP